MNVNLESLLERVAEKRETAQDKEYLKSILTSTSFTPQQLSKYNISINKGENIHIGDCTYITWDEESVQALVEVIQTQFSSSISSASIKKKVLYYRCIGGSLGSGLGVGIFRALIAPLHNILPFIAFSNNFWVAAFLGTAVTFGISLPIVFSKKSLSQLRKHRKIAITTLGATFFGLAHLVLSMGLGLYRSALVGPLGFLAGLGISFALSSEKLLSPRVKLFLFVKLLCSRSLLVAFLFVLIQQIFDAGEDLGTGLVTSWHGNMYAASFGRYEWSNILEQQYPDIFAYVGLIDAAMVGCFFTSGLMIGLKISSYWTHNIERTEIMK